MTVKEYRTRHHKCLYCKHIEPPSDEAIEKAKQCGTYFPKWWCAAKMKFVRESIPRPFCKLFEIDNTGIEEEQKNE